MAGKGWFWYFWVQFSGPLPLVLSTTKHVFSRGWYLVSLKNCNSKRYTQPCFKVKESKSNNWKFVLKCLLWDISIAFKLWQEYYKHFFIFLYFLNCFVGGFEERPFTPLIVGSDKIAGVSAHCSSCPTQLGAIG